MTSLRSFLDPRSQLRFLLSDYFAIRRDPWLQLARRGRLHVLLQAPAEISQLLHEAGLANEFDQEVIDFWDELAALLHNEKDKNQLEIGRAGERLSVRFETNRTGIEPKWVALDSNQYGYDVLTRVSDTDETPLKIETKCSSTSISSAKFHLTRFEWETAERSNNYQFHIWALGKSTQMLANLTVVDVSPHIPINQNQGSWENVEIPFGIFESLFAVTNLI